jgi:hypothetical protein
MLARKLGLAVGAEADPTPPATGDGGAAAHLHGPSQLFANVINLPTTNATDPGSTVEVLYLTAGLGTEMLLDLG